MTNVVSHRERTINELVAGGGKEIAAMLRLSAREVDAGNLNVGLVMLTDIKSALEELARETRLKAAQRGLLAR